MCPECVERDIAKEMTKLICLLATLCMALSACDAYKILVLFPMTSKSHGILGQGYVNTLLDAGHEVTYVTPYPPKPHPRLRLIDISENVGNVEFANFLTMTQILNKEFTYDTELMVTMISTLANRTLKSKQMQDLMLDPKEKFDLAIIEWMFTEVYSGLAAVFDCPFIWSSSLEPHDGILQLIDDIPNPAFTPGVMSNNVPPFNFLQRASELGLMLIVNFFKNVKFRSIEEEIYTRTYEPIMEKKGRPLPPFNELRFGASMVLGNSHVSVGQPVRLPQSYASVGGYHIDSKIEPLPQDLKSIIENATHGVIYFSLGSQIRSKDFPDSLKQELLQMFGELKQTILWKFEDKLSNVPKNVHFLNWAPQQSILSHPNCKLFITHGGLLSTTETIYFGKPVIGMPIFADQFVNVERAVTKGYAKQVELDYDVSKNLKPAIEEMINNPKYAERAQLLSTIFHDRTVTPAKEIVHWVEHVIKTKGAPHLRSPALQLSWYQKMYLDLLSLIAVTLLVISVVLKKVLKLLFSKKAKDTKKKKH